MAVSVRIVGEASDLLSLEEALREEPPLLGSRVRREVQAPKPGELGPVAEALEWTADNKDLVAALATALVAWVKARRTKIAVRVGKDEVTIDSTRIPQADKVAAELARELRRGGTE